MDKFYLRLIEARKLNDLNQTQLAKLIGLTRAAVSSMESKKRAPSCQTLIKLSDALHVSIDYLLGRAMVNCRVKPSPLAELSYKNRKMVLDIIERLAK